MSKYNFLRGETAVSPTRRVGDGTNYDVIDRSTPFNPGKFIGDDWTIWRGPADGDGLEGEEEQDKRSLALTGILHLAVSLVTGFRKNETRLVGEGTLLRLKKAGHVRLDAKFFQMYWENQHLIPEIWKEKTDGSKTYILFDGTILRNPIGDRCSLCLYWSNGRWHWNVCWLDYARGAGDLSVVLVS